MKFHFFSALIVLTCNLNNLQSQSNCDCFEDLGQHSDFRVGQFFHLSNPLGSKSYILLGDKVKGVIDPLNMTADGGYTDFKESIIADYSSIEKAFNLNSYLSASYLKFSFSNSLDYSKFKYESDNSVTLTLDIERVAGENRTSNISPDWLTKETKAIWDKSHSKFIENYGDHVISGVQFGNKVRAVITIRNVSRSFKQQLESTSQANLRVNYLKISGEMKANLNEAIRNAKNAGLLDIRITVLAKADDDQLNNHLNNILKLASTKVESFDDIKVVIGNIVKDMKPRPIRYYYSDVAKLFGASSSGVSYSLLVDQKTEYLSEIKDKYLELTDMHAKLSMIKKSCIFSELSNQAEQIMLENEITRINQHIETLKIQHRTILNLKSLSNFTYQKPFVRSSDDFNFLTKNYLQPMSKFSARVDIGTSCERQTIFDRTYTLPKNMAGKSLRLTIDMMLAFPENIEWYYGFVVKANGLSKSIVRTNGVLTPHTFAELIVKVPEDGVLRVQIIDTDSQHIRDRNPPCPGGVKIKDSAINLEYPCDWPNLGQR